MRSRKRGGTREFGRRERKGIIVGTKTGNEEKIATARIDQMGRGDRGGKWRVREEGIMNTKEVQQHGGVVKKKVGRGDLVESEMTGYCMVKKAGMNRLSKG